MHLKYQICLIREHIPAHGGTSHANGEMRYELSANDAE